MGTWDSGSFGNDAAMDFLAGADEALALSSAFDAITARLPARPEVETAQRAVAAADCVAAMLGHPSPDLPEDARGRLAILPRPDESLIHAARDAVSAVLSGSELTALWAEEDAEQFNRAITDLIDRLNPELPFKPASGRKSTPVPQTCVFCDQPIAEKDLAMLSVHVESDDINQLDQSTWCHFACLNGKLHPSHIIQNWKFDPDTL